MSELIRPAGPLTTADHAARQITHPKETRLYLAGKISADDWRNDLVATRGADAEIRMDNWLNGLIYVGPYFIGCDHRCAHGPATHGCGNNCMNDGHGNTFIRDRCLSAISRCDVVFAWINSLACYGTLVELGYAAARGKHVAVAFPIDFYETIPSVIPGDKPHNQDFRHDLWFAESIARDVIIDVTPHRAFTRFVGDLRQQRIYWGTEA